MTWQDAAAAFLLSLLLTGPVQAQVALPAGGFSALPSFAWPRAEPAADAAATRWEGSYATMSAGFLSSSSRRFGSYAGPTLGFEGGKAWREGDLLVSVGGAFEAMTPLGGLGSPGIGGIRLDRDFAGSFGAKVGAFVADNVVVYGKVGVAGVHETVRFAPSAVSSSFSREDIVFAPYARVGAEWAITDRLSVAVEVGASRTRLP